MPKSQLNRLLDNLCATDQNDPEFLQIAGKIKECYLVKCSKPKVVRKKKVKVCGDCGSDHIECKDALENQE
jgi:hypothetical protein